MSKIGKKPIAIKEGVTISLEGRQIIVRGPLGELRLAKPDSLQVEIEGQELRIKRLAEDKKTKAMHGTLARLIANAIKGVTTGFSKTLEVVGTGYRAQMQDNVLVLSLGFSHLVHFTPPPEIKLEAKDNKIVVSGISKEIVGNTAAAIKRFRKPDAYKGKGIRYLGEKIRLKPGKAATKAGIGPVK
ncbi:MAG TPA: 50S ribosomal protein L6 [Clostridia bacterium]|nr:50S ribosomal protein L6 [Clostridia bacterium]